MFRYLSKIELKQSLFYYLFLFLFFFFWNLFSLFIVFFYLNIQNLLQTYEDKMPINLLIFSENNPLNILNLSSEIKKISYVKNIVVISPEELLEKSKKDLSPEILKIFSKEELKSQFPYILKIYPTSIKDFPNLKAQLNLLTKTNSNIEISEPGFFKLIYFAYFFKLGFLVLAITWALFYLIFLYFLNTLINSYLKSQTQIFLLLGGTLKKFKFLRFLFVGLVLIVAFIYSAFVYFYISDSISSILPLFKTYPDFSQEYHLFYFGIYIFLTVFFLPWLTIIISYKKYEI
uniref:Cell division protein FtsX n=1 Tax=Thermodesulfobacterium geofontis TaxID=1295609 RepID=A0A7V5XGI3_9BACT